MPIARSSPARSSEWFSFREQPMNIVRAATAPFYTAPGHAGMQMRRLQGREAGPSDTAWLGLSVIAPGGGTTLAAAPVEKFYLVIDGVLSVETDDASGHGSAELGPLDSIRVAPNESRRLSNRGTTACSVLLVMPNLP
jgi:hypothetical protein